MSRTGHWQTNQSRSFGAWKYEQQWKEQGLHVLNPELPDGEQTSPDEGDQVM